MLPHQQRVIDEKRKLDDKVKKLIQFIHTNPTFESLDPSEQERLKEQCETMWKYSEILGKRIEAFPVQDTAWNQYKRIGLSEMRPYVKGEDISHVRMSEPDRVNGSPKIGDMIARNPKNHNDQWLVSEKYFQDNLEPI